MPHFPDKPLMNTADTAAALGIPERTIRRMIHNGSIPAIRNGHKWMVPTQRLRDLVGA